MAGKKGMKHFGKAIESEAVRLREQGKTIREIATKLGLKYKQIEELLKRYRYRQKHAIIPKPKGRPRKVKRTT